MRGRGMKQHNEHSDLTKRTTRYLERVQKSTKRSIICQDMCVPLVITYQERGSDKNEITRYGVN